MKVQNDKVLFIAESKYQKYSSIFTQISSVAVAIYCCLHIKENPPVIIIFSLFLLLVFVLCGHGIVRVYKDSIEFEFKNSLVPFFTKRWHFGFHEIVSIDMNLRFGRKEQFLADLTNSSIISLSTWCKYP